MNTKSSQRKPTTSRSKSTSRISRRTFLQLTVTATVGGPAVVRSQEKPSTGQKSFPIMTVLGPIADSDLGLTLPHEHITTDFLGAEKLPPPRYDREQAMTLILPALRQLKERGVKSLVECTPNYIGRDVRLLQVLSQASGLHLLTNTGYYGAVNNKFMPRHAFEASTDALAERWMKEWIEGIDGTLVKPGFIKLGVGKGPLSPLHEKLVRAAAQVHRQTGLTIAIHTGNGEAARDEVRILADEGVAPDALIWVHAQNDPGPIQIELARQGVWVSLDGYSLALRNPDRYQNFLLALREEKLLHRVLISHDDGWAVEGEAPAGANLKLFGNGNPQPYQSIFTRLLPDLKSAGFTEAELHQLMTTNPAAAFAIRVRKT